MTAGTVFTSLLWFALILALIPAALWLLRRTPAGGAAAHGLMRTVAVLPLSPSQRIVTIEVGQGEARRWLVLGVTGQTISALHEMAPQAETERPSAPPAPFSQLMQRLQTRTPERRDDD